jgi:uncharacterized phage protein (TIGR01671 family)
MIRFTVVTGIKNAGFVIYLLASALFFALREYLTAQHTKNVSSAKTITPKTNTNYKDNMRDIIFRVWDCVDAKYIKTNINFSNCSYTTYRPHVVIEQYTGMRDSTGKCIYEGDIVQFAYWWFDGNEAESNLTGTIVYSDECMSFQLKGVRNKEWEQFTGYENDTEYLTPFSELNFEESDFTVIGNIHQNPELLKQDK